MEASLLALRECVLVGTTRVGVLVISQEIVCAYWLSNRVHIIPFTIIWFISSRRLDTEEPSGGPSEDHCDISMRDHDIILGQMSGEEQRVPYPYEVVKFHSERHQGLLT